MASRPPSGTLVPVAAGVLLAAVAVIWIASSFWQPALAERRDDVLATGPFVSWLADGRRDVRLSPRRWALCSVRGPSIEDETNSDTGNGSHRSEAHSCNRKRGRHPEGAAHKVTLTGGRYAPGRTLTRGKTTDWTRRPLCWWTGRTCCGFVEHRMNHDPVSSPIRRPCARLEPAARRGGNADHRYSSR